MKLAIFTLSVVVILLALIFVTRKNNIHNVDTLTLESYDDESNIIQDDIIGGAWSKETRPEKEPVTAQGVAYV